MDSESKIERRMKLGGGQAYRSRLESFVDLIREQRQQRRTWQEIATLLRTEKGCTITFQGLHQFYRRFLKRKARPHWESEAVLAHLASVKPQQQRAGEQDGLVKPVPARAERFRTRAHH